MDGQIENQTVWKYNLTAVESD